MKHRRVIMVTADRRIDRRILLEAESVRAVGFDCTVIALPAPEHGDAPGVVRMTSVGVYSHLAGFALRVWARFRNSRFGSMRSARAVARLARSVLLNEPDFWDRTFSAPLADTRADLYVAHDLPTLRPVIRHAQTVGAAVLYDSHELWCEQGFLPWVKRRWERVERVSIGQADAVTAVNRSIVEELERRYAVRNVSVVHNAERVPLQASGVEPLFHRLFGLPADARIALYQGGILAERNLEALVRAGRFLRDPRSRIVFMGAGEHLASLKALAARLNVTQRVLFHPEVEQADLLRHTRAAHIGVIPYQATCLNNYYCTPNKLFEFIAAGLPIVATDLPELRRFVAGYQIGSVGDTSSADKLAAMIEALLTSDAALMAARAMLRKAQQEVNWSVEGERFIGVVRSLLERTTRHAAAAA